MIRFLSKYRYWFLAWGIFILLRLPSLFEPYWYGDEGICLTLGQGIRKGLILYKQIYGSQPPTLYYLAAISKTIFGFRLILSLFMVPTVYLFYQLAQKFLSQKLSKICVIIFILLTSVPALGGNIANAEIFMALPTIAGFLLFFNSKNNFHFYLTGLLFGVAFTLKLSIFIEVGFLIFYLFLTHFSEIKKHFFNYLSHPFFFSFGFLTPIIFYFIYYYFLNSEAYLYSVLIKNFWPTPIKMGFIANLGVLPFIFLLTILGILIILYCKKIIKIDFTFILGWFFVAIFGFILSTHHLIQLIPPFCLLLGYFFKKKLYFSKFLILISLFFFGFLIKKSNFYFYPTFTYYRNFYNNLTQLQTNNYRKYFGENIDNTYQVAEFVNQSTLLNEKIFIWGDQPCIYALSDRLPLGRYTIAYHITEFDDHQEIIDSLKSNSVKFIIYSVTENRTFNQLDDILNRYYFLTQKISNTLIFQKR